MFSRVAIESGIPNQQISPIIIDSASSFGSVIDEF
jgi:hypothetical protein